MFGEGQGMPDMSQLLAQAQQMQEQLVAAKDQLAEERVTGSAANGLVSATVTGTGDLVAVDIKPAAIDPDDTETLGDMVVAAVRDAGEKANELAADRLGPLAGFGEGGPDLPGGFGQGGPELPGGGNPPGFH